MARPSDGSRARRIRFKLMMALPVAALMLLAGGEILDKWGEYAEGRLTEQRFRLHAHLAGLVHDLQLERGLSAGFSGSARERFGGALHEQRAATNAALEAVRTEMVRQSEAVTPLGQRRWRTLSASLAIVELRARVDADGPSGPDWRGYSERTAGVLQLMGVLDMSAADETLVRLSRTHLSLRWLIERAGQERAALNRVFSSGSGTRLGPDAAGGYFALQQTLAADFESVATAEHRVLLRAAYEAPVVHKVARWRRRALAAVMQREALGGILAVAGYGGAIHHFKNYVLRGTPSDARAFGVAFRRTKALLARYRAIEGLTARESEAIETLTLTLNRYQSWVQVVGKMHQGGADVRDIDEAVKVDDVPAITAIQALQDDLAEYTPEEWFALATERIGLLEAVADKVLSDLLERAASVPKRAVAAEAGYAALILVVLLVSLFLVRWYELLEIGSRGRAAAAAEELETRVAQRTAELSGANQQLKDQQTQLLQAEKLSSIGLLASGVAHEVNNPLLGIKSCLEGLRAGTVPERRLETYWDSVEAALVRIEEIVRGLTDYARQRTHEASVVSLSEVAGGCLRLAAPALVKKRIQVHDQVPDGTLHVLVDPNQLMQALLNILLNAVHASPVGADIEVSAEAGDGRHGISVQDHGTGIPDEILNRIFDPFFSTKPEGEGTGLGLAVTLGLMQSNDGSIEVDTAEGRGTKFTIWLPSAQPDEGASEG